MVPKFTNVTSFSRETLDSWKSDYSEVLGSAQLGNETHIFFRVKFSARLPDEDFKFVMATLKAHNGTYWHPARCWIVEVGDLSRATDEIEEHFAARQAGGNGSAPESAG